MGDLQKETDSGLLHVYVKMSDLSSLSLTMSDGQQKTFASPRSPKRSALTAALADPSSRSLATRNRQAVLHLCPVQMLAPHDLINPCVSHTIFLDKIGYLLDTVSFNRL